MLKLRRGVVVSAQAENSSMQRVEVELEGEVRSALADVSMVGVCRIDDVVVVNVSASDLKLGSGGFDLVHVNLTRGLTGVDRPNAHVMKLNYSSLQHPVLPVEEGELEREESGLKGFLANVGKPVAVLSLHGQLPPFVWAAGQASPGLKLGYIQTAGGALPGGLSQVVRTLRLEGLLAGHLTAGTTYGGEEEAITLYGALKYGFDTAGWDAAVCAPGPGILGSASQLGHGGMYALDSAHAAVSLGLQPLIVPRLSEGDPRARHRGLSHHSRTVLELLLKPVAVAWPEGQELPQGLERHSFHSADYQLNAYVASGLPSRTMGRTLDQDQLFFAAALAGGKALSSLL